MSSFRMVCEISTASRALIRDDESTCRAGVDFALERFDDFGEGLGAEVALAAMADGDGASFVFFGTDDEHVGNFLELRIADFRRQLFVTIVKMDAQIVALQSFGDVLGVVGDFFADRADLHLHGREPERKCAGVMLDQDAEEALHGTEQGAVNHERLMLGAVFGDVLQAEASGQIKIELHGGELPGAADGVNELDVDLGAVEGGFALHFLERDVHALHGVGERGGGAAPVFGFTGVIFGVRGIPIGELDFEFVEAKIFHDGVGEIDAGFDFRFDLRGHAENVRVVLRESADAEQAVKHAAAFVAIDGAELGEAHGKITIAAQLRFIDEDVAGAVHGLELVVGLFDLDGAEHVFFEKSGVAAGFPEVEAHDVRGEDEVVAALEQFVAEPVLNDLSNEAAFGMPEDEAGAGFFLNAEEVELDAELPMIAALGFFKTVQMFVQLFLREESHGVNALELGIAFLALPVGARDVHQLERLDAFGRRDVRAAAEVDEFSGGVERNHRLAGLFFHQLAFENLITLLVEIQSFGLGNELALVWEVLGGELVHLFFDFGEIFRSEGLVAEEFVEEAGVNRRTDAELHVRVEFHHGGGEQMRGGMTEDEEGIRIFFGEDLQVHVMVERPSQVNQLAFAVFLRSVLTGRGLGDAGDKCGIGKTRRNFPCDIGRSRALGDFLNAAIRQCDVNLLHVRLHLEGETLSLSAASTAVKTGLSRI